MSRRGADPLVRIWATVAVGVDHPASSPTPSTAPSSDQLSGLITPVKPRNSTAAPTPGETRGGCAARRGMRSSTERAYD